MWFANISLLLCGLSFHPLHGAFCRAKVFSFNEAYLEFHFMNHAFGVKSKKSFPESKAQKLFF
jgi:hypothetical protein